eukprot:TRINITY_DN25299_c0_g1_i9.p3 TRINITY_DN25299_c0_g1~~TRINITY_DN25299_c0_g1_i9.p3  ORF type:complete len:100 (-),score=14.28 TRINITY_DN25299_c0_g1_i9:1093-1392(-)
MQQKEEHDKDNTTDPVPPLRHKNQGRWKGHPGTDSLESCYTDAPGRLTSWIPSAAVRDVTCLKYAAAKALEEPHPTALTMSSRAVPRARAYDAAMARSS